MAIYPQLIYGLIWFSLLIVIIAVAAILYRRASRSSPNKIYSVAIGLRKPLLFLLIIALGSIFIVSTMDYPYPLFRDKPVFYVKVEAFRFGWRLNATEVPANVPIAFLVTSRDVNHGFGLYTIDGRLLGQVQAMPGYVNMLVVTLPPGEYVITCMEYCGFAHHAMVAKIRAVG